MRKHKATFYCLSVLIFFSLLGTEGVSAQSVPEEETSPQIILGNITAQLNEIPLTPPIKVMEVYIEIINKGKKITAPPNTIKVILILKEAKLPNESIFGDLVAEPEEFILDVPLPPKSGQLVVIGYPMPEMQFQSVTFDVQINPPEGEKKTVSFQL